MKRQLSVWLMAALYAGAGIMHCVRPDIFTPIVPAWVPNAEAAVLWSGVAEIVLSMGLLWKRTRFFAAIGIIALLIAVFPANVRMAKDWTQTEHPAAWVAVARLPLQALFIFWAWTVRKA